MTDNEIIKALQLCTGGDIYCKDCPYTDIQRCRYVSLVDALDLINRQNSEISVKRKLLDIAEAKFKAYEMDKAQLESDIVNANMNLEHLQYEFDLLKQEKSVVIAEAVKEFAEMVKEKIRTMSRIVVYDEDIEHLVIEFTEGEQK
jgi:hypothetical protein